MAISDLKAKELAQIEPPRSMSRLIKLFDELSREPGLQTGASESVGIGQVAAGALGMAKRIDSRSMFGGQAKSDIVGFLMRRHNISSAEIQNFSSWLVKWNDKRSQTEVLKAPEMFLGQSPAKPSWGAESLSEISRRRPSTPASPAPAPEPQVVVKEVMVERVREVVKHVPVPANAPEVRVVEDKPAATATAPPRPDTLSKAWTRGRGGKAPDASGVPGKALAPEGKPSPKAPDPSQFIGGSSRAIWSGNLRGGSMVASLFYGQATAAPGAMMPVVPQAPAIVGLPAPQAFAPPGLTQASSVVPAPGGPIPVPYPNVQGMELVGAPAGAVRGLAAGPLVGLGAGAAAANLVHRNLFMVPGSPQAPVLAKGGVVPGMLKPGQKPPVEAVTPLMGQMTLIAPPLRVASERAERSGSSVAFDWKALAGGADAVDEGGLARLKAVLPPGAHAIYPALPPGSLGPQAVNLRLAPSLLSNLLEQGYGPAATSIAPMAAAMATGAVGGKAPATPLQASIVPEKRPAGDAGGMVEPPPGKQAPLAVAGQGQASRGNALDFLGMPVRIAPSLGGRSELVQEVAMRSGQTHTASGDPIRPHQFAPLREKLFPSFGSVKAEPDEAAWKKAAPSFGMKDEKPLTVLSPDARIKPLKSGQDVPQLDTDSSAGARRLGTTPIGSMPTSLPIGMRDPRVGLPSAVARGSMAIPHPAIEPSLPALSPSPAFSEAASAGLSLPSIPVPGAPALGPRLSVPSAGPASSVPDLPSPTSLGLGAPSSVSQPLGYRPPSAAPSSGLAMPSPAITRPFLPSTLSASPSAVSFTPPTQPLAPAEPSPSGVAPASPLPSSRGSMSQSPLSISMPAVPSTPAGSGPGVAGGAGATVSPPSLSLPAIGTKGVSATPPGLPTLSGGPVSASYMAPSLALPASPAAPTPTTVVSSVAARAPQRLFAPPSPVARPESSGPLAIQRWNTATPKGARAAIGSHRAGPEPSPPPVEKEEDKTAEVNLLANEVWSILKRRFAIEHDRRGRW